MPLAYYVASMNLESVFYERCPIDDPSKYEPNKVLIWTDTFTDHTKADLFKTSLAENNQRLKTVLESDIRVIIGNPPYSVGQESQNDDNQNEHYEVLDARLAETYVAKTNSTLKGKLYDSYIRAYRWASDRIGEKGVIGFVTNAGWLESNSADGMRKCMAEEFSSIYIWHLKGNQRTVGEQSRKEGGKVFGQGSRAPVAIVILVKNPEHKGKCKIHFAAVDDYLTREEKLKQTADAKSIYGIQFRTIVPDAHGDWLSQRDDSFERFIPVSSSVFKDCAIGVSTNRDFWVYGSSIKSIESNVNRTFDSYARSLTFFKNTGDLQYATSIVNSDISWSAGLKRKLEKKEEIASFSKTKLTKSMYRPYFVQNLYYERNGIIERPGRWNSIIINSTPSECNYVICVTGVGAKSFCCLMVDKIPCLDFVEKTQCFPRYLYEQQASAKATESASLFGE